MKPNEHSEVNEKGVETVRKYLAFRILGKVFLIFFSFFVWLSSASTVFWLLDHYIGRSELPKLEPYHWDYTLCQALGVMPILLSYVTYYAGSYFIDRDIIIPDFDRKLCLLSIASSTVIVVVPALSVFGDIITPNATIGGWTGLIWIGLLIISAFMYFRTRKADRRKLRHFRIMKLALIIGMLLAFALFARPS